MIDASILASVQRYEEWVHHSGTVYHVIGFSNLKATKPGWEPTVIYHPRGEPDNWYSRPIVEFYSSCQPVTGEKA